MKQITDAQKSLRAAFRLLHTKFLKNIATNDPAALQTAELTPLDLSSIEEINEVLVDIPRRHAYFGGTGDDLFAYCLENKTRRILDRATLSPLGDFADFDGLFLHVLDEAYDCVAE